MNLITIIILTIVFITFFIGSFFASKYVLDLIEEQNNLLRELVNKQNN